MSLTLMDILYNDTSMIQAITKEFFTSFGCSCFAQLDRVITCLLLRISEARVG